MHCSTVRNFWQQAGVPQPAFRTRSTTVWRHTSLVFSAFSISSSQQQVGFVVRPAQPQDVPRLATVEQLCAGFSAQWSAADIQDELSREIARVLVAADSSGNTALGYIVGWLVAGELQVLELAVHPAHQSLGIGSALLAALILKCRCDTDGVEVALEVKAQNSRAIGLYRRHGFIDVGLRRKYYDDGSDALLMMRRPVHSSAGETAARHL